ncbi:urease accessory protein UreD [Paenibacillus harenae]|uniref:Urease accessory protein UreD n=1 Tax=Paenibacillus harenae TaxID=306543 RepID=A0ABT9TWE8_PAEHA|nr:urease accessory protein UreD [Paenibacillus harenae]MDQ0110770.1 urease accessory protein [Paenibacillus harenae]
MEPERHAADESSIGLLGISGNGQPVRVSELRASFAVAGEQTYVAGKYHTAPIKIAKAFPVDGQLAVIVMDVSPGLLSGDRYELDWTCEADAHVMLTNQSYMKVHPSMPGCGSSMRQTFELAENAVVENMPEPIMLFKNASFANETIVRLRPGAIWMQADVLCPGRTLRGERFDYMGYRNSLSVYYGEELLFAQRQRIEPRLQRLEDAGCMGEMTHLATFYLFSDRVTSAHLELLRHTLDEFSVGELSVGHTVIAGVSRTHRHGIAVTAASTAAWPLQRLMREVWHACRDGLLGKSPLRFMQTE